MSDIGYKGTFWNWYYNYYTGKITWERRIETYSSQISEYTLGQEKSRWWKPFHQQKTYIMHSDEFLVEYREAEKAFNKKWKNIS